MVSACQPSALLSLTKAGDSKTEKQKWQDH
jgi:hypothetical protein